MAKIDDLITQIQELNIQQGVIIARLHQLQEGADTEENKKEGNDRNNCELKIGDQVTILTIGHFQHKTATNSHQNRQDTCHIETPHRTKDN